MNRLAPLFDSEVYACATAPRFSRLNLEGREKKDLLPYHRPTAANWKSPVTRVSRTLDLLKSGRGELRGHVARPYTSVRDNVGVGDGCREVKQRSAGDSLPREPMAARHPRCLHSFFFHKYFTSENLLNTN